MDATTWARHCYEGFDGPTRAEHGAFHDVVIAEDRVARILLGTDLTRRAHRERAIHQALPADIGGIRVPRLLSDPVVLDGRWGYVVTKVPGTARTLEWDQAKTQLHNVLDLLHQLDPPAGLPPVRAWCGGDDLPSIVSTHFGQQLGPSLADAVRLVEDLQQLDRKENVFTHGDFGPHNLLWEDERVCSMVDFDHATVGDPAIDVAPLIGFYGAPAVSQITDPETLDRAMRHRATLSLQVAAAAHISERPQLRDHALGNFRRRWAGGVLYDPAGTTPR